MKDELLNLYSVDYVNFEYGRNIYNYGVVFPSDSYHIAMSLVEMYRMRNYAIVLDSDTTYVFFNDDSFTD